MADNKDFLSQFSTDNVPDSFKEEERVKVEKPKKTISPKIIIIAAISLIIVAAIVFLLFFMPKIEVEDFTGYKQDEAIAWIRQQGIESSGILFKEEYNFDYEKGTIISQDPATGKVTEKAKITFIVSSGPDPDESIKVPNFSSMDKEEINVWIKSNKLLSTKINTTYSDDVEKDGFIKADYTGCDEDTFTRGCTLKISISKGAKPQDEITMANFVNKTFAEFEAWATPKKINLNKAEAYSDTVDMGLIISQSIKENEKVTAGATVDVVVSKGKGVKVPNFATMSDSEIDEWIDENKPYIKVKEKYSNEDEYVLYQSAQTGSYIGSDNTLHITLNLGNSFYFEEEIGSLVGTSFDEFEDKAIRLQEKGIYIETHDTYVDSTLPRGTIVSVKTIWYGNKANEDKYAYQLSTAERLPLYVHIRCNVSKGGSQEEDGILFDFDYRDYVGNDKNKVKDLKEWIESNNYDFKLAPNDLYSHIDSQIDSITYNGEEVYGKTIPNDAYLYVKVKSDEQQTDD